MKQLVSNSAVQLSAGHLSAGHLSAGKHSVIWDGTDSNNKAVSPGVYFYKVKTKKDCKISKMILLK